MSEVSIKALKEAIRNLHGYDSKWLESVHVKEMFEGKVVWDGTVQVFELQGHPNTTRCYAWSHRTKGSNRQFVVVLHQGPVDSPIAAVKAAIVQQYREGQKA